MYRESVDKYCHIDKTQLNSPEEGDGIMPKRSPAQKLIDSRVQRNPGKTWTQVASEIQIDASKSARRIRRDGKKPIIRVS